MFRVACLGEEFSLKETVIVLSVFQITTKAVCILARTHEHTFPRGLFFWRRKVFENELLRNVSGVRGDETDNFGQAYYTVTNCMMYTGQLVSLFKQG
jgi:hypothetical protein